MMPTGCREIKLAKHLESQVDAFETYTTFDVKEVTEVEEVEPSNMFVYRFSDPAPNKQTTIELIVRPDGSGGLGGLGGSDGSDGLDGLGGSDGSGRGVDHYAFNVDLRDPFGPCEPPVLVKSGAA